jgi:hypothetical protein
VATACLHSQAGNLLPLYRPNNGASQFPPVDAIVVLAGGQDESRPSGLPHWVECRLQASAELLKHQPKSCRILCSGGGAYELFIFFVSCQSLHENIKQLSWHIKTALEHHKLCSKSADG